jgi:predicted RND superfamily exporter protein
MEGFSGGRITTIAAFGSLITSHRGLDSFAADVCVGVAAALILTVAVVPAVLHLVRRLTVPTPP